MRVLLTFAVFDSNRAPLPGLSPTWLDIGAGAGMCVDVLSGNAVAPPEVVNVRGGSYSAADIGGPARHVCGWMDFGPAAHLESRYQFYDSPDDAESITAIGVRGSDWSPLASSKIVSSWTSFSDLATRAAASAPNILTIAAGLCIVPNTAQPGQHVTGIMDFGPDALTGESYDATGSDGGGIAAVGSTSQGTFGTSTLTGGDIALAWLEQAGAADVSIANNDLAQDAGLRTACLLSLFTDRRADDGDQLPDGGTDRRGWWADAIADIDGDKMGSRLWLLERSKFTPDELARAELYAKEALAWLVDDKVAERIEVTADRTSPEMLGLSVAIYRPQQKQPTRFRFESIWRAESAGVS